jgi:hypothetical protein
MGVGVDMIQTGGVESAGPSDQPVDFITLGQQKFSEVGAILARNAGDECYFAHILRGRIAECGLLSTEHSRVALQNRFA